MLQFVNAEKKLTKPEGDYQEHPMSATVKVQFNDKISKAYVVLRGWDLQFIDNKDHHLSQAIVKVEIENEYIDGREVDVKVTLGLRDKNTYDDPYEGTVFFTVIGMLMGKITEMTMKYV